MLRGMSNRLMFLGSVGSAFFTSRTGLGALMILDRAGLFVGYASWDSPPRLVALIKFFPNRCTPPVPHFVHMRVGTLSP